MGIIPYEAPGYSIVMEFLLPSTVPLLLFRDNLRHVIRLSGTLLLAFLLGSGTNLLLFTFPSMFIATLGCVYLHFQNKVDKSDSKSTSSCHRLTLWRRPVLVMAPLGIVTAMELVFAAMFVVLLIWWQAKFRSVSLRLGYIGNICWAFLFFPVTRGSSILPLIGLTSESSIKYHIWLGHLSMILFTAHSVGFIIYWAMTNQMAEKMLEWSRTYVPNIAGEIAFVIALAMWVTSYPRVRRKMFEVFFYTHHLYALYIFFYALHVGVAYLCMILPGIFLFLVDRYLRFLQSMKRARLVSARLLPCGAFELNFSKSPGNNEKGRENNIVSCNDQDLLPLRFPVLPVSMHSQRMIGWTSRKYIEARSALKVTYRRESLVMVSGGSGITPFISIIRELIFQSTQPNNSHIPRVILVCAFKNTADLTMLDLLLPISGPITDFSKLQLQIEVYITRETDHPTTTTDTGTTHNPLQTIWFKPSPSDWPITPALGPNSWLWLGAIISSSFVTFLLFLGILTCYYIHPIDHNSGEVYNFSLKTIWDIFLVCVCVFVATSAVFLWQKRRNAREGKEIQNVEVPTPTSPGSWLHGGDRELESLPHQSLVQATNLHFGGRPNLKKILFGCKGSDVGVLVCGPRKMRHEVAKICSSGLADNLHFESISFNW
ncbi:ferric reduction oxidase 4 [Actinidia rufa]|uniref:Ferric reduction oxidase 4 n=1 Tax=Actinidia rufa TaxID=165716 RepID=A0A7J0ECC5_9ERIC|nr:ferric reduction oxidase 4 [Actinidia rufa]